MNEENKHIKHGLEHLQTYEPKPALWDTIEAELEEDSKPKIVYWRWFSGIAAMIAISITIHWFVKDQAEQVLVESTKTMSENTGENTVLVDTQVMEINLPTPVKMDSRKIEVPTTGPYDGKAGEAMRNPDIVSEFPDPVSASLSNDSTLTFTNTTTLVAGTNSTVTYNWAFGDSPNNGSGLLPDLYFDPSASSTDYSSNTYTFQGTDQWSSTNAISDVNTNYKKSDNIGYVDGDGVANYVDKEEVFETYNVGEIGSNPDEQRTTVHVMRPEKEVGKDKIITVNGKQNNVMNAVSVGTLSSTNISRFRLKAKQSSSSEGFVLSNRVLQSEKYQCVISDSISGFYGGRADRKLEPINTESYLPLIENEYVRPTQKPLSTFGIDVDNASYAVMRTKINANQIVPKDAVRVEEFINYFDYNYPEPTTDAPFSINLENASCPWNTNHQLVRIGLKGKDINYNEIQNSNLVFLIDVSGSMDSENKLPLVKKSMKLLVDQMGPNDRIAIVTYAGAAGLALESTRCHNKDFIKSKIDKLDAGGSTAGGEGIKLAYKVALENLIEGGNNRVIMCTDGDFNVGQSSDSEMKQLIINNRNKGIFITACGFGMGNYQDSKMETIADNGNGNYFYIDTYRESEKVFNREIRATLFTIAKDVKIQVEFNPKHVKAYRLIGYENRLMPPQDFNDDTKDGGELGAGHTVTALYEIIPATSDEEVPGNIELKYQSPTTTTNESFGNELLTVKLRYKKPNGSISMLISQSLNVGYSSFNNASEDFQFAAGVALYAQQLRQSKFISDYDFSLASEIIHNNIGSDVNGDRAELLTIIKKASKNYQVYTKE